MPQEEIHQPLALTFHSPSFLSLFGGGRGSQVPESPWTWLISQQGQDSTVLSMETSTNPNPSNHWTRLPPGSSKEKIGPIDETRGGSKRALPISQLRKTRFLRRTIYKPERALKRQNELIHFHPKGTFPQSLWKLPLEMFKMENW